MSPQAGRFEDFAFFPVTAFVWGVLEAFLLYADRLVGLGGWYFYAANLGLLYVLFFGVPFFAASLWLSERSTRGLGNFFGLFVLIAFGARVYRIHLGKLVGLSVGVLLLLVLASVVLGYAFRRVRWIRRGILVALVALMVPLTAHVFWMDPSPDLRVTRSGTDRPPVVWITSDTLRADHLDVYGHDHSTFPRFERWRDDFVTVERSYSQSHWTVPSVASYFTSLYPFEHGKGSSSIMHPKVVLLPQILQRLEYRTIGVSNNPLVSPSWGFGRGFDRFYVPSTVFLDSTLIDILDEFWEIESLGTSLARLNLFYDQFGSTQPDPDGLVETTKKILRGRSSDELFVYLHFFDPHDPYNPERKYYPDSYPPLEPTPYFADESMESPPDPPSDTTILEIQRRYDGEIRHVDRSIDRIFRLLKENGLYRSALIVVTSDHGEAFYEHGEWNHGGDKVLNEELIRVPLFVKFPENRFAGRTVEGPVEGIDLPPTVTEVLAADFALPYEWRGESMLETDRLRKDYSAALVQRGTLEDGEAASVTLQDKIFAGKGAAELTEDAECQTFSSERDPLAVKTASCSSLGRSPEDLFRRLRRQAEFSYSSRARKSIKQRQDMKGLGYLGGG